MGDAPHPHPPALFFQRGGGAIPRSQVVAKGEPRGFLRAFHAEGAEQPGKAGRPGEIGPAVVVRQIAALSELAVHQRDAQRKLNSALDQHGLGCAGLSTDMRNERCSDSTRQFGFAGTTVEFLQRTWPAVGA
jgi:hypothetical protein